MGLLAKAATKKRIQPQAEALSPSLLSHGPWATNGGVPVGGLVRSAVLALDITGARSTSIRGRTSSLAMAFAPSAGSQLWVTMVSAREWSFVLGIHNGQGGIAADWSLTLRITDSSAEVATGHYLTHDGALVHGDLHDALRAWLLSALAQGERPDPHNEEALSSQSLARTLTPAGAQPSAAQVDFQIHTRLDTDGCWRALSLMGHRELGRSEEAGSWGLGLPENDDMDRVTLEIKPGLVAGRGRIGSDGNLARRVAVAGLRSFIERALFLLGREDPGVQYVGPPEWAGGREL